MSEVTTAHRLIHRHRLVQLVGRSAAHELRNISQALQMSVDLLRDVPEAEVSIPDTLDGESFRLLELADRLGRWHSTRVAAPQAVALAQALVPLHELLRHQPAHDRLTVVLDVPQDFPLVDIVADELLEVVWELVTNALQASASDAALQIRISASAHRADARLMVADDGPGIPAAVLPQLFTVIDAVPGELPRLGLAVARALLRSGGGDLELGAAQAGTTFVCTLPMWPRA